ncbi:unnamed protein product [Phytophthora fragariaefolia]|uniref:Unnamed protein product n=1 Tax=Phytophthora fragariaefolia TaxID=1490495 RepID=A0A9W7CWN4_9STRA|nr:unnamed protein product [Phytophthora fragariaefolia]
MNTDDEMKHPVRRNLDAEFKAATTETPVKTEPGPPDPELEKLRAEVSTLSKQTASAAMMAAEMEKMRSDFAQLMSRQAAAKSLHDAELAELRAHAQDAPQLHAEIVQLKITIHAMRSGAPAAGVPPVPGAPTAPTAPARTTPKIKDVMCRKFDDQEVYPGLGSGFEDFILEYEQALYTESLLNQSR